jgi:hypothetical protein
LIVAAETADFSPLRGLAAFDALEARLKTVLKDL